MFQRRTPLTRLQRLQNTIWSKKGGLRPWIYAIKRMLRINAHPHNISIGVACGIFGAVNPIYGLHMLTAAILAFILKGNMVVAMLATWFGNPLTYPFLWAASWITGRLILDQKWPDNGFPAFHFSDFTTHGWRALSQILTPMLVGFPVVGLVFSILGYAVCYTVLQNQTKNKNKEQFTTSKDINP